MRINRNIGIGISVIFLLFAGCEEEPDHIVLTTGNASAMTASSAIVRGSIVNLGGNAIGQHGFVYHTADNPTVFNECHENGTHGDPGGI